MCRVLRVSGMLGHPPCTGLPPAVLAAVARQMTAALRCLACACELCLLPVRADALRYWIWRLSDFQRQFRPVAVGVWEHSQAGPRLQMPGSLTVHAWMGAERLLETSHRRGVVSEEEARHFRGFSSTSVLRLLENIISFFKHCWAGHARFTVSLDGGVHGAGTAALDNLMSVGKCNGRCGCRPSTAARGPQASPRLTVVAARLQALRG